MAIHDDLQPRRAGRPSTGSRVWPRFAVQSFVAIVLAGALTALAWQLIPTHLDVTTGALGYPTRFNFNIYRQWYIYGLLVFLFPFTIVAIFVVSSRSVGRRRARRQHQPDRREGSDVDDRVVPNRADVPAALGSGLRIVGVGAIIGLEAAVALHGRTRSDLDVFIATAAAYLVGVSTLSVTAHRLSGRSRTVGSIASLLNTIGATFCILGLYGVSRSTEVKILSPHTVRHFSWMPLWVAVLLAAAVLSLLIAYLRRGSTAQRLWIAERWTILLVAVPAAFFVLNSSLTGSLGTYNSFEEGQLLVGAQQLLNGAFPWRDIILTHGLLTDAFALMPGMVLFEASRWGAWAGYNLLVGPVYWLAWYGLILLLTRGRWVYGLLFLTVVVLGNNFLGGFLGASNLRLLPVPVMLAAFTVLLRRATWTRATAFMGSLIALVVLTPEALVFAGVFALVLVAFEAYTRPTGSPFGNAYRRSVRCLVAGVGLTFVFVIWLAANGALGSFVFFFETTVPSHLLQGIPISGDSVFFTVGMILPIAAAIIFLLSMTGAIGLRRDPRVADWVAAALAGCVVLYYSKFLGRADLPHLQQYLALAAPFLVYVVYRIVDAAQAWVSERPWRSTVAAAGSRYVVCGVLVVAVLAPSAGSLAQAARRAPTDFTQTEASPATAQRIGYVLAGVSTSQLPDLDRILRVLGGPRPRVWDFSNDPAELYFFLGVPLLTRYDNVSIAIDPSTQEDVISELRTTHPDVIVYDSLNGLNVWDGLPNMVRHYDISAWILRNYRPAVEYDGYLLYLRDDRDIPITALQQLRLAAPISFVNLYTDDVAACEWGYVPNFFDEQPATGATSSVVQLEPAGRHFMVTGFLSAMTAAGAAPPVVFLTQGGRRVATGSVDTVPSQAPVGYGFAFQIDASVPSEARASDYQEWAQAGNGVIERLPGAGQPGNAAGVTENARLVWEDTVSLPTTARAFTWLQVTRAGSSWEPTDFTLSLPNEEQHSIAFSTRGGAPTPLSVRLDNCSEWYAMPGSHAVLTLSREQPGLTLRLRG